MKRKTWTDYMMRANAHTMAEAYNEACDDAEEDFARLEAEKKELGELYSVATECFLEQQLTIADLATFVRRLSRAVGSDNPVAVAAMKYIEQSDNASSSFERGRIAITPDWEAVDAVDIGFGSSVAKTQGDENA